MLDLFTLERLIALEERVKKLEQDSHLLIDLELAIRELLVEIEEEKKKGKEKQED